MSLYSYIISGALIVGNSESGRGGAVTRTNAMLQQDVARLAERIEHKADKAAVAQLSEKLDHSAGKEDLDKVKIEMSSKIEAVDHKLDDVKQKLIEGQNSNAHEMREEYAVIKNEMSHLQGGLGTLKWLLMFGVGIISAVGAVLAAVVSRLVKKCDQWRT